MCNKFKTKGGCVFGDKCSFARELGKLIAPSDSGGGRMKPHKISVDASLDGIVVGKEGAYSKRIYMLLIRDHESDPNLKYIELEGEASEMVRGKIDSNSKKKLCKNFTRFGERCHISHINTCRYYEYVAALVDQLS